MAHTFFLGRVVVFSIYIKYFIRNFRAPPHELAPVFLIIFFLISPSFYTSSWLT